MTMVANTGHVMTLANSIIGVSVLAMPFCFKQCGITLAILMLILSSVITRLACHFLVKSSSMCKRRNFEFLAFYTFGPSGKLLVELGIIGFMMGTCVAFFVVIGDLGPEIVSKIFLIRNDNTLRSMVLLGLGFCVVLPLGLLRNIESLAAISTVTIGFYFLLIVKIFLESFSHLLAGDWIQKVNFWQPEGVLQCIPIFSMALSCQTQIFEIYESLPSPTLDKMNSVVHSAVNICTIVYISVGLLGYIAYCSGNFTGNILLSFAPSFASEMYKLGFVMSIAVSFPLVIFPCRASLYSLIFRRMPIHHELSQTSSYIPDLRFKCLTAIIVGVSMVTGLLIPSIELVLGFVGSTIGVAICVIFPTLSFINLTTKETNERLTAKVTLLIGFIIMITGSMANYQAATENQITETTLIKLPELNLQKKALMSTPAPILGNKLIDVKPVNKKKIPVEKAAISKLKTVKKIMSDQKKEPPFPVAPAVEIQPSQKPIISPPAPVMKISNDIPGKNPGDAMKIPKEKIELPKEIQLPEENINKDAIEKEEKEMKEIERLKKKEDEIKEQELLQKLKQHQDEQKKLLREQEQILNAIKNRKSEDDSAAGAAKEKKEEKPEIDAQKPDKVEELNKIMADIENLNEKLQQIKIDADKEKNIQKQKLIDKAKDIKQNEMDIEKPKPVIANEKESENKLKMGNVPLPLAKFQTQSNRRDDVKDPNAIIKSKQEAMGRDILQDLQQPALSREKRDAETTVAKDSGECPVQGKIETKQNNVNINPVRVNKTENISQETDKKFDEVSDVVKPENLIKNSQHISIDLRINNELSLGQEKSSLIQGESKLSAPKKRDLKSMRSNERDRI